MKVRCEYCGSNYEDTLSHCPNCGAASQVKKTTVGAPRTIEELKQWYNDRHLPPPETTRFFIGINYTKPKAFGIYKDTSGEFIVYKNKADGTRAIRYQGTDEEYAVNELWQRLKDEIVNQKNRNRNSASAGRTLRSISPKVIIKPILIALIIVILAEAILVTRNIVRKVGYYEYPGLYDTFCYYHDEDDNWYYYNKESEGWNITVAPSSFNYDESIFDDPYYVGATHSTAVEEWGDFRDVTDTVAWKVNHPSSSSGSSGYDWDSGSSWDSGGTDWDSDW